MKSFSPKITADFSDRDLIILKQTLEADLKNRPKAREFEFDFVAELLSGNLTAVEEELAKRGIKHD